MISTGYSRVNHKPMARVGSSQLMEPATASKRNTIQMGLLGAARFARVR